MTVAIPHGIHAAIAHHLREVADSFSSSVFLKRGSETASLRSIVAMLSLGITAGTDLEIIADGIDESAALFAIAEIIERASSI